MKTTNVKRFLKTFAVIVLLMGFVYPAAAQQPEEVAFAMCRPAVRQIKNIETMFEKNIIPLPRIKLVCVYHEDEIKVNPGALYGKSDYTPSFEYVKKKKLDWVEFVTIKGKVGLRDLFRKNRWTQQFREIFNNTRGIIFTGGADLPPAIYGEENLLLTQGSTPMRSFYEVSFLFHLLGGSQNPSFTPFLESRKDYTVLGICLGCQTMNVACGGSLYQDIPSQVYKLKSYEDVLKQTQDKIHSSRYIKGMNPLDASTMPAAFHRIKFKKKGLFVKKMKMKKGDKPYVLTSHHQALNKIGKNLEINATSMDGKIVEGVEHKKYPNVLGIQFHPEPHDLYRKGKWLTGKPGGPKDFNYRNFLENNPPSMLFHQKIWQWFSESL